jgi:putative oxidoreductase
VNKLYSGGELAGRILVSAIFILSGVGKIGGYAATQGYMEAMGVPGALLPLVIVAELGGGLLLLAGWQARLAALALAGFSALAGLLFHYQPDDPTQMIMLMKNFAIAGGLLFLVAHGAGAWSVDGWRARRAVS